MLRALCLFVWTALRTLSPDAPAVAYAVAVAAEGAPRSALGSPDLDAAVLAVYAAHESRVRVTPAPESWDARARVSCGVWQEPCSYVATHTLAEQASWWLAQVRARGLASVDSSSYRAARRLAQARLLLDTWRAQGVKKTP